MKSIKKVNSSRQKLIRMVHCGCFALVMFLSVGCNCHILGLGRLLSTLLIASVFGVAGVAAVLLVVKDRGVWRIIGFVSLILYGVFLLPLVIP